MDQSEESFVFNASRLGCAVVLSAVAGLTAPAWGLLQPQNVLLLYNSQNAESLAVRNAYIAARPGIVQFDLNDATILPGEISRANYNTKIRARVKDFINGVSTGTDISGQIMSIATTRGLPAVLSGNNENSNISPWASLESELSLLQQDLEQGPNPGQLPFRYNGMVDNPYHRQTSVTITSFSRANVKVQRAFSNVESSPAGFQTWVATAMGPGDIYLVCRLDSAPTAGGNTAVQNIQSLITRSQSLSATPCQTQVLLDADLNGQLDAGSLPPRYTAVVADYFDTQNSLTPLGFIITRDQSHNFITGSELADQSHPVIALGSYGENHDLNGGENPPGAGTYITTYNFHPAAMLISYESYNGNSLIDGTQREDHQQGLDFIAFGGSFTICHVKEPFSFTVADVRMLTLNLMQYGLTYAEAAYTAIPALSWQATPVGDPLAQIAVVSPPVTDFDCDLDTDVEDLYAFHLNPRDVNLDSVLTAADYVAERNAARSGEVASVTVGR